MKGTGCPTIEWSDRFREAYARLGTVTAERVRRTIQRLGADPTLPGLHVEKLEGARSSIRSCRVTQGVRIIFEREAPERLRLLFVGTHEEAYRCANRVLRIVSLASDPITPEDFGGYTVFMVNSATDYQFHNDLGGLFTEADVRGQYEAAVAVIETMLRSGTEKKAPTMVGPGETVAGSSVSVIPSARMAPSDCGEALLIFCFDGDSFDDRLREAAYHAAIDCPGTKLVVLITSQWNPRVWKKKHEAAFVGLTALVTIFFAGFGGLKRIA